MSTGVLGVVSLKEMLGIGQEEEKAEEGKDCLGHWGRKEKGLKLIEMRKNECI